MTATRRQTGAPSETSEPSRVNEHPAHCWSAAPPRPSPKTRPPPAVPASASSWIHRPKARPQPPPVPLLDGNNVPLRVWVVISLFFRVFSFFAVCIFFCSTPIHRPAYLRRSRTANCFDGAQRQTNRVYYTTYVPFRPCSSNPRRLKRDRAMGRFFSFFPGSTCKINK